MAAKTTVSLPDDMHEWAKNQPDLNVSEVLRNALQREQATREKLSEDDLAGALVDRLRGSGGRSLETRHADFYRAGGLYAAKKLSVDEMKEIEGWYFSVDFREQSGWTLLSEFVDLTDEFHGDPMAFSSAYINDLLGTRRLSSARVEAFTKGIVDLWRAAEDQIDE